MANRTGLIALVVVGTTCGWEQAPKQPIPFNHRIHAGVNQIGCTMCHAYAEHSPVAGIPSLTRCYGCHRFVDKEKPDVIKMVTAYEQGRVLEWERVYRVPDHVYFAHQRHIAAGLRCQECHGEVQTMDVLTKASSLSMGWCVDCHREKDAPLDCLTCHK